MQEINLLQSKVKDNTFQWERSNRWTLIVIILVLIVEGVAGGSLYVFGKNADTERTQLEQDTQSIQRDLSMKQEEIVEASGFQAQTKNIKALLGSHVVWDILIQELEDTAYINGRYINLSSQVDGILSIVGEAADYTEIGKIILALQTSEKFASVRLLSTTSSTGEEQSIRYTLEVVARPDVFLNQN